MPKKLIGGPGAKISVALPRGSSAILDKLVAKAELGNSRTDIVRYLLITELQKHSDNTALTVNLNTVPEVKK